MPIISPVEQEELDIIENKLFPSPIGSKCELVSISPKKPGPPR